ncbi:ATP-binding protein [Salinispora fenicalii]|uniref:ATP-binding protein n=1 Tax=Salinispora fenicalii TaxID=1137263 RepID=UPI0009E77268|nr:adenylate/guanylate cyclase domain-containing protein [Salinispora fenicalii]
MNQTSWAEVPRMSPRIHLPTGWVTFVFTDIEGSTRLAQLLGPDYRPVLREHRRLLRRTVVATKGAELLTEGDSFFLVFADASAALAACLAAQRALTNHDWPTPDATPRVRMGLHTGWAEPRDGEYVSAEVHRAARIAAAAHGGQVLCSAATAQHAHPLPGGASLLDLGLHRLRGFDDRERLFQLTAAGLERQFPRPRTADAAAHNLPTPVTSFVGRRAERAELRRLVQNYRLVTVVGAGGAGKTRLAVELAADLLESHPDGVWFVDLAAVAEPGLVAYAVAAQLGLRPEPGRPIVDTLVEHAAARRMLMLLDTGDAQLSASAQVISQLLAGGVGVRVLATSRESFGLPGEVVWRIPPLSVDPPIAGAESDAVALLLDRATAARGGRRPDPAEWVDLHRVVRRLEGLPLAIELAAVRLRVLSVGQLADRLDDVLGVLDAGRGDSATGLVARHRSMQANLRWSYRQLGVGAARLLRWLAVFAEPVDLATVEWLLEDDQLDSLSVLVEKSMVLAEPDIGGSTYRMLDPIRAYAIGRLAAAGEEPAARNRHVAWSAHALRRLGVGADGRPATLSLYAFDPLAGELRTALRWCVTGGSARAGLALVVGLDQWWRERGLARRGRLWLSQLYDRSVETGERIPDVELAAAHHTHSLHAGADGDFVEELRLSQQAEVVARRSGDAGLLARVLASRAAPLVDLGQFAEAEQGCREVIDWAQRQDVVDDALFAVLSLAELLWRRGALDEAAELLGAARPVEAGRPVERGRRTVDMLLGLVALARGDLIAAHEHLLVSLRSRMAHGFHRRACDTMQAIAVRCAAGGDPLTAARLFGAAQARGAALGAVPGINGDYLARWQAQVREVLGDVTFDRTYGDGAGLGIREAAAVALGVEHPDLAADSTRFATGVAPSALASPLERPLRAPSAPDPTRVGPEPD